MLVVPSVLLTLFKYVFAGQEETFNRVGGPLVGLFPFVIMFLITSITMLRERTTGTLERLMTLPLSKLDLLAGYGIAFALVAAVQASVTAAVAFGALGLDVEGPIPVVASYPFASKCRVTGPGVVKRGVFSPAFFSSSKVSSTLIGLSIAVPQTSPSPCAACVSPSENSAPSTPPPADRTR